jgi:hypothetical protein
MPALDINFNTGEQACPLLEPASPEPANSELGMVLQHWILPCAMSMLKASAANHPKTANPK